MPEILVQTEASRAAGGISSWLRWHIFTSSSNEGWFLTALSVVISTVFLLKISENKSGFKMQWIYISPPRKLADWKIVQTHLRLPKICVLQIRILINSRTEVSICIESIGIRSQRPLPSTFCSQSRLKLIVTKVCSLSPPRQIEIGSLESFSVVEEGLFSNTGYAGVYVTD